MLLAVVLLAAAAGGELRAHERYSIDDDNTNCRFCHGDFRNESYVGTDGVFWGNLHNIHRFEMTNFECEACHLASDEFPVLLGESEGAVGLPAIGCVGCHGRAEDATPGGTGSEGYGLATQRRHELANVGPGHDGNTCKSCHLRADPATGDTPVGENVLSPYYANPNWPDGPQDPCNADGNEDYAGSPEGIDNDGDLVADQADSDCSGAVQTPGEVSRDPLALLAVTQHDPASGTLTLSFEAGCGTLDTSLHYGPLAQVSAYGYAGEVCNTGATASYTWDYSMAPDASFFLIVGHDGTNEGSYGTNSELVERPPNATCARPQNLEDRCD
jgi:hypothetical protein